MKITVRAARIIYNLPNNMVSEDALRHAQWPTFFMYYKEDILRLFL